MIITVDMGKDRWISLEQISPKRWRVRDTKRDSFTLPVVQSRWLRYSDDECFWQWCPWNEGGVYVAAEFKTHREARAAAFAALLSS